MWPIGRCLPSIARCLSQPIGGSICSGGQDLPTVWLDDINLKAGEAGVYRRDFEHGIVLVNTLDNSKTVDLGGTFRHIRGEQDPTVNNGALATHLTLLAKDAIIMTNLIHASYLPLLRQR